MKLIALLFLFSLVNSCGQKEQNDNPDNNRPPSLDSGKRNSERKNKADEKNKKTFCEIYDAIGICAQKASIEQIESCLKNDVTSFLETKVGEKELEVSADKKAKMDSAYDNFNQCLSNETDLNSYKNCHLIFVSRVKSIIGC